MRRLTIPIVLALSLIPAGLAAAKEPVAAKVCGPSDCHTTKDDDTLMALIGGGSSASPPGRGAAWYSVVMTIRVDRGRRDHFSLVIVPSRGVMRGGDATEGYSWTAATPDGARAYRRLTRGLAPFPADTLKGVGAVDAPKVRVDEVVLPREEPAADGGGASPLPWIAGGVVLLLAAAGLLIRRRGLPWPKPAES